MGTTVVALTFSTVATMDAKPVVVLDVSVVFAVPLTVVKELLPKVPSVVVRVTVTPSTGWLLVKTSTFTVA